MFLFPNPTVCVIAFRGSVFMDVLNAIEEDNDDTALHLAMGKKRLQWVRVLLDFDAGILLTRA